MAGAFDGVSAHVNVCQWIGANDQAQFQVRCAVDGLWRRASVSPKRPWGRSPSSDRDRKRRPQLDIHCENRGRSPAACRACGSRPDERAPSQPRRNRVPGGKSVRCCRLRKHRRRRADKVKHVALTGVLVYVAVLGAGHPNTLGRSAGAAGFDAHVRCDVHAAMTKAPWDSIGPSVDRFCHVLDDKAGAA